ncbi:hypothetical protein [Streptomyces sp. NPDC002088]|uniref:hypothetical protein n=1 Tax=Streptomyces sp. NPDC002088 TaxID=3154665 RepID=UPI00331F0F5A
MIIPLGFLALWMVGFVGADTLRITANFFGTAAVHRSVADELRFPGRSWVFLDAGKRSVVPGGIWTPAGGPWAVAAGCGTGAHRERYLPPVALLAAAIRRLGYPPRRTLSAPVWTRAGRGPRVAFLGTGRILKETGIVIAAPTGLAVTRTATGCTVTFLRPGYAQSLESATKA